VSWGLKSGITHTRHLRPEGRGSKMLRRYTLDFEDDSDQIYVYDSTIVYDETQIKPPFCISSIHIALSNHL
jgi:hypothetical protein